MEAELEVSSIKRNTAPPRHTDTDVAHQTQTKSWSSTRLLSEDRSLLSPWVTVSRGGDHLTSDVMFGSLSPVRQHSAIPQTKCAEVSPALWKQLVWPHLNSLQAFIPPV